MGLDFLIKAIINFLVNNYGVKIDPKEIADTVEKAKILIPTIAEKFAAQAEILQSINSALASHKIAVDLMIEHQIKTGEKLDAIAAKLQELETAWKMKSSKSR